MHPLNMLDSGTRRTLWASHYFKKPIHCVMADQNTSDWDVENENHVGLVISPSPKVNSNGCSTVWDAQFSL